LCGRICPELLRFIKAKDEDMPTGYFKHWKFWLSLLGLVLLPGFTAWLLGAKANLEAFAYGFSAPELLSRAGGSVLNQKTGGDADRADIELDEARGAGPRFSLTKWWNV
jgi:hypothetical protein